MVDEKGAVLTVLGQVNGVQTRKVDQTVITMTKSQVWPQQCSDRERPYNPKHDWPFRGYGYYGTGSYSP